jgi:hypothetical protein
MKPNAVSVCVAILLGLGLALHATFTRAETLQCKEVPPLPATITTSGVYCLKSSRQVTQPLFFAAITINANNVVLDLNGFRLSGRGVADSHETGIQCDNCRNVTVRNGTIQGFAVGIRLGSLAPVTSWANVIEDIRAVRNAFLGIGASGDGVIIRNNHVAFTGGSTVSEEATGILVQGTGNRVINNDIISARQPGGVGRGIHIVTGGGFSRPPDNLAINNRITDADEGIRYFESAGKFRDNLTSSVAVPYIGGTDAGNND